MQWLLHGLDPAWNILYKTTSNALLGSLSDDEIRVSVLHLVYIYPLESPQKEQLINVPLNHNKS